MEITLEEIQKKFEGLPEDLKWAIMAANVDDNIIEIGQKEGLNVEQMGQLSLETHMVMFGFTHPDKFEESLKNSLQLPDEKTKSIVSAVNEKILKEIRQKMVEISAKEEHKTDTQVLKSAGIEIVEPEETLPVPEKLELDSPTTPIEKKTENTDEKIQAPSILTQKLSGFVKNNVVETEHSLQNVSPKVSENAPEASVKRVDPYREIPE